MKTLEGLVASIVVLLDGTEWSGDTLEEIAELLRNAGYRLREPFEVEDN